MSPAPTEPSDASDILIAQVLAGAVAKRPQHGHQEDEEEREPRGEQAQQHRVDGPYHHGVAAGRRARHEGADAPPTATGTATVINGGMVIDPRAVRAVVQSNGMRDGTLAILTHGERVVAELVARGLTNSEIAASSVLAGGTVKNDVSAPLRKFGQRDRTALALKLYKALGR